MTGQADETPSRFAHLKVGDRVQVFDINGARNNQPRGGFDGEVVKVGRKLITVRAQYSDRVYRMDTGQFNDKNWSSHYWIKTVEEAAEYVRYSDLMKKLEDFRIQFTGFYQPPIETVELLVRTLEEAERHGHG